MANVRPYRKYGDGSDNRDMAIEIEKKYRLDAKQFAELADLLAESGAQFAGEEFPFRAKRDEVRAAAIIPA